MPRPRLISLPQETEVALKTARVVQFVLRQNAPLNEVINLLTAIHDNNPTAVYVGSPITLNFGERKW